MSDELNNIIVLLLILCSLYLSYIGIKTSLQAKKNVHVHSHYGNNGLDVKFNNGYNSNKNDILLNPYSQPLRDDRPLLNETKGLPINIKTQGYDAEYRQIGILTRTNGDETILPLMGRPLITNRDKWQFYTINDQNNSVKLPIVYKNKSCTCEYGCDNLYDNDVVKVKGYNDDFKVSVYDNNTLSYIPFI
jgi:hypothetical protein